MFKKLISLQSKTITSAAMIIGALSLVSRFLGIFRDRILAAEFGAGDILDIYYAAFRLPDFIFNLLVLGAISAGLIPVFTGLVSQKKSAESWRLINGVLNTLMSGLILLCVALFFMTPLVMKLITPGFSGAKMVLVVQLTKIMYLSPIFLGVSAIYGSVLQSYKKFFVYALAPIFYNIGIIVGALYFAPRLGIYGLALGVVFGSLLHFASQSWLIFILGYRYRFGFFWQMKEVKTVWRLMIPRTLTLVMGQINIMVVTVVASTLAAGSLAIFNFADNLQNLPLGVFGISFAIAALPTLSALAAQNKKDEFVAALSGAIRQILFFVAPASVLIYVLRAQIVRLILGSGHFDWLATRLTAAALALFMIGLFAQSLTPLLIRGFYAWHDSRKPFWLGLASLAVNFTALLFFRWLLGFQNGFSFFLTAVLKIDDLQAAVDLRVLALPLAIVVSAIFSLWVLFAALRMKVGRLDGRKIFDSAIRIAISALGAGLAAYAVLRLIDDFVSMQTFIGLLVQGSLAGLFGLAGYWLISWLLKVEEMAVFVASVRKKIFRLFKLEKTGLEEDVLA